MDKTKVTWKVDMFDRVKTVCENNQAILTGLPALDDSFADFKLKLADVKQRMEAVSQMDNGAATVKDYVWEQLAMKLDALCSGLRAYAKKQGNLALMAQSKFSPSGFINDRGTDAIALAQRLLDLVNTHVASLANYNVTPAKVTIATNLLTQLDNVNTLPTTERTNGKALREILVKMVRATNDLVKTEMDPLVVTLKEEQPLFADQYFAARRLQRTGIRHKTPPPPTSELAENLAASIESMQQDATPEPVENGVNV